MRAKLFPCILLILLAACPRAGSAQASGELLLLDKGARATALAGALSAALKTGPFGFVYNPAGLANQDALAFGFDHNEWGLGMRGEYLAVACPLPQGAAAAALDYFSYGALEYADENGLANGETFAPYMLGLKTAYGLYAGKDLAVGAQLSGYQESIRDYSDLGGALALGALWQAPWKGVMLGLAARNIGATASGFRLPGVAVLGCSWTQAMVAGLTLFAEAGYPWVDQGPYAALAAEYPMLPWAALRLGFRHYFDAAANPGMGLTGGIGLQWQSWQLGYALMPMGEFGMVHRISLEYAMPSEVKKAETEKNAMQPGTKPVQPEVKEAESERSMAKAQIKPEPSAATLSKQLDNAVQKHFDLGMNQYSAGNYKAAINEWKMVLDIKPSHAGAKEFIRKADNEWKEKLEKYRQEARQAKARKDLLAEVKFWKEVLALSPGDLESQQGMKKAQELAPAMIQKLYNDGLDDYIQGRYREAIQTWEKVLILNPQHYKALENIQKTKEKMVKME